MIRQLTAQEQHVLGVLVARVIDGHELPVIMTPEWVRPYVMNKVKNLVTRQVERIPEDPEGEDLQFNKDIPMPFGWTFGESGDFELDRAIAIAYNQESAGLREERVTESFADAVLEAAEISQRRFVKGFGRRDT